jgi:multidrug efflux pump subunit AcrA (membrane-fusion protein)
MDEQLIDDTAALGKKRGFRFSALPPVSVVRRLPTRLLISLAILVAIAGLLLAGILPRIQRQKTVQAAAQAVVNAVPAVNVATVRESLDNDGIELPGNIEAIQTTTISARTSGYLRRWYVDIGDRVKTGQLLAEIDTPEVVQQLQQAQAALEQARAALAQSEANLQQARTNMELGRVTYDRYSYLSAKGVLDRQSTDQAKAGFDASTATVNAMVAAINSSRANINANQANVKRLTELLGYNKVYAPFVGIITARFVDVGSLIGPGGSSSSSTTSSPGASSGMTMGASASGVGSTSTNVGSGSSGGALFSLARIDSLRVYINVPQAYMASIHPGQTAAVAVKEIPQKTFQGKVVRTASALDASSRTLLTEVDIDNKNYELLPGMYALLKVTEALPVPRIRIPSSALIVRSDGPQVAVVTADNKVHLQRVVIGRDYGTEVEITDGLAAGQGVIVTINDGVQEGRVVNPSPAASAGS